MLTVYEVRSTQDAPDDTLHMETIRRDEAVRCAQIHYRTERVVCSILEYEREPVNHAPEMRARRRRQRRNQPARDLSRSIA